MADKKCAGPDSESGNPPPAETGGVTRSSPPSFPPGANAPGVPANFVKEKRKGKLVLATGVFDILHLGHLYYLMEARKLGDRLVVVVARDETARRVKRAPIVPEHLRVEMLRGLKPVDDAVLGDRDDFYRVVETLDPDIIALGHDQRHDPDKIRAELKRRGLRAEVIRLPCLKHDLMATRRIIEKILAAFGREESEDGALDELE
jgi:FAD synthetase